MAFHRCLFGDAAASASDRIVGGWRPPGARWRAAARNGLGVVAVLAAVALGAAACGSGAEQTVSGSAAASRRAGTAQVAFAGSLLRLDDQVLGPAFTRATGYGYQGRGAGSDALSQEIRSKEISPGVFESIGPAPILALPRALTDWYVPLASSPLVVAYDPHGPEAAVFRAAASGRPAALRAMFEAMARPGFRLGRTDPATDPQGQAFVMMVELAQRQLGLPSPIVDQILGPGARHGGGTTSQIFAETALDAALQAGEVEAASAFLSQAVQLHLAYVPLPATIDFGDPADAAGYATASIVVPGSTPGSTVTVHGAPLVVDATVLRQPDTTAADAAADAAFVAFLLSPSGRRATEQAGYSLLRPTIVGPTSTVPAVVRRAVAEAGAGSA
jgi:molybdate/tungstate transport system substrate-binding protein